MLSQCRLNQVSFCMDEGEEVVLGTGSWKKEAGLAWMGMLKREVLQGKRHLRPRASLGEGEGEGRWKKQQGKCEPLLAWHVVDLNPE